MSEDFGYNADAVLDMSIQKADRDGSYAVAVALFELTNAINMLGFGEPVMSALSRDAL